MGRTLVVLVVLVIALLVATGVIYVTQNNATTSVNFDQTRLRELGDKVKQEGSEAIEHTGQAIERAGEKMRDRSTGDERPAASEVDERPAERIAP